MFTRSGDDLSLLFNGSEDQVTVAGWFRCGGASGGIVGVPGWGGAVR